MITATAGRFISWNNRFLERVLHRELFIVGLECILTIKLCLLGWFDRGFRLTLPACKNSAKH
jgi:hypothetical protein